MAREADLAGLERIAHPSEREPDDPRQIGDRIRAAADPSPRFAEEQGDDEGRVVTGFHLVQGGGGTLGPRGRPAGADIAGEPDWLACDLISTGASGVLHDGIRDVLPDGAGADRLRGWERLAARDVFVFAPGAVGVAAGTREAVESGQDRLDPGADTAVKHR